MGLPLNEFSLEFELRVKTHKGIGPRSTEAF